MPDTPVSLLDRLRKKPDDATTWQRWFDLYQPILHRWLRRPELQPADVDDVIQEVLLIVIKEIPTFKHTGRPGAFRAWLRQVMRHRIRGVLRARAHLGDSWDAVAAEVEAPEGAMDRLWEQEHDQLVLRRLLEMIKPDFAAATWEAFRRQVFEQETAEQAAAALAMTANAARIAKHRVLNRLKQEGQDLID